MKPVLGTCRRLDYHNGPCNGLPRKQCVLKNKLEKEGKIMVYLGPLGTNQDRVKDHEEIVEFRRKSVRGWLKQLWYQLVGKA